MASRSKTIAPRARPFSPSQIANAESGSDFMKPDRAKADRMRAENAQAATAEKPKAARKPNPASTRKAAAVEAYEKEYGRKPAGRTSAARLEKEVWNAQQTRIRVDNPIKATSRPSATPRASSTAMTMPSRMPPTVQPSPASVSPIQPSAASVSRIPQAAPAPHVDYSGGMHDPHARPSRGMITKGMLGVGVGAAAVQGYLTARDRGDSVGVSAAKGALNAVPQALVAGAPYVEKAGRFMKEAGFGVGKAVLDNYDIGTYVADRVIFDGAIAGTGIAGGIMGTAGKAIETFGKVASRFALPASLAMGAVVGAMKDENRLRGAGRGMVSALDPTGLFMKKGMAEQMYDSAFGSGDRPLSQQPRMNQDNPRIDTYRGKGGINRHQRIERQSSLQAPEHFAAANEAFRSKQAAAAKAPAAASPDGNGNHLRGFQNPNNLIAAIKARGGDASRIAPA